MNTTEAHNLLISISKLDGRFKIDSEETVHLQAAMWAKALHDVPVRWALEFVATYYRSNPQWSIMVGAIATAYKRADAKAFPEGHCRVQLCECTHESPCDYGWIEAAPRHFAGRVYPSVGRCPRCASALPVRQETGRSSR